MENRMIKLRAKGTNNVTLKVIPGHFATNHSHINYYIDITTLKTRESEAMAVAKNLVQKYVSTTIVDTIVCLDGLTINKAIEAILYYGGTVAGISAIFSAIDEVNDYHINAVFRKDDVPDYQSFNYHKCPMCKAGQPIEALVNGFGYSKL